MGERFLIQLHFSDTQMSTIHCHTGVWFSLVARHNGMAAGIKIYFIILLTNAEFGRTLV